MLDYFSVPVMDNNGYRACNPGISLEGPLSEEERKTLERKLVKTLNWIGVKIPQEVELKGKMVPLKEVIWDLMSKKECYTEEEKKILYDLEYALEKKLKDDIKEVGTDESKAEVLGHYCEAMGLMRAIVSLKAMVETDRCHEDKLKLSKRIMDRRKAEAESWLGFLKRLDL
jgi:hypothetical protein